MRTRRDGVVPTLIILVAVLSSGVCADNSFPQPDLAGTWWLTHFQAGSGVGWIRGDTTISAGGGASFPWGLDGIGRADSTGPLPVPLTGVVSHSVDGWLALLLAGGTGGSALFYSGAPRPEGDVIVTSGASETSGGSDLVQALLTLVRLDPDGYLQEDLKGRWAMYGLEVVAGSARWIRGAIDVEEDGTISGGSITNSDGTVTPLSGTLTIDAQGIVTTSINATWEGALSERRDVVVACQTLSPNHVELDILVRLFDPYDIAELQGRHYLHDVRGGADPARASGTVTVGSAGNFINVVINTDAGLAFDSGTFVYQPDGTITRTSGGTWAAVSNPKRTLLVGSRGATGNVDFFVATRQPRAAFRIVNVEPVPDTGSGPALDITWTTLLTEVYDLEETTDPPGPGATWTKTVRDLSGLTGLCPGIIFGCRRSIEIPLPTGSPRRYRITIQEP